MDDNERKDKKRPWQQNVFGRETQTNQHRRGTEKEEEESNDIYIYPFHNNRAWLSL